MLVSVVKLRLMVKMRLCYKVLVLICWGVSNSCVMSVLVVRLWVMDFVCLLS